MADSRRIDLYFNLSHPEQKALYDKMLELKADIGVTYTQAVLYIAGQGELQERYQTLLEEYGELKLMFAQKEYQLVKLRAQMADQYFCETARDKENRKSSSHPADEPANADSNKPQLPASVPVSAGQTITGLPANVSTSSAGDKTQLPASVSVSASQAKTAPSASVLAGTGENRTGLPASVSVSAYKDKNRSITHKIGRASCRERVWLKV